MYNKTKYDLGLATVVSGKGYIGCVIWGIMFILKEYNILTANMSKTIALLLILVVLIAAQCGVPLEKEISKNEAAMYAETLIFNDGEPTVLHRTIDYEAGVVCWWVYSVGFDCLLLEDTELSR